MSAESVVLLKPRPYATLSGRLLLLPLLPKPNPAKPLPAEVWTEIFTYVLAADSVNGLYRSLLTSCKAFHGIAVRLMYSKAHISTMPMFEQFCTRLYIADQKWDSIRRIPYSTPGRWVQTLDLSDLPFTSQPQALRLDSLLIKLFPLLPFLEHLYMNPSFILSRTALETLAEQKTTQSLRSLEGINYVTPHHAAISAGDDPLVNLLRSCVNLENLDVVGHGLDPSEVDFTFETSQVEAPLVTLSLPHLHTLTLLSMHHTPLMLNLLHSPLPALRKLTITPYDDVPFPVSLVSQFISTHGSGLRSLLLLTPKSWPTRLHPSPDTLLQTSPSLRHLSLENPIPRLILTSPHPLQILSIPRPSPDAWDILQTLLPMLPSLQVVRARDVRWLRKGMTWRAQEAGVQGELKEWRRRLGRRRIAVLDADWKDID